MNTTKLETAPKGKSVKSSDPRKAAVVAALKAASGGSKITSVVERKDGSFAGHCMASGKRGYDSLGYWAVELAPALPEDLGAVLSASFN